MNVDHDSLGLSRWYLQIQIRVFQVPMKPDKVIVLSRYIHSPRCDSWRLFLWYVHNFQDQFDFVMVAQHCQLIPVMVCSWRGSEQCFWPDLGPSLPSYCYVNQSFPHKARVGRRQYEDKVVHGIPPLINRPSLAFWCKHLSTIFHPSSSTMVIMIDIMESWSSEWPVIQFIWVELGNDIMGRLCNRILPEG